MEKLKMHFITSDREYREGEVFVYEQKFTVKDVKKAVFTATALGVYEAEINGVKIGKQMFAPGYSYYPRRVLYQTHEVSALLREGENTLRVYLGQGWYCGRFLCENKTQIYGEKPAVSWILNIEDAGGVRNIVSGEQTDELESPYEYAGEYDGEKSGDRTSGIFQKRTGFCVGADADRSYVTGRDGGKRGKADRKCNDS